MAGQFLSSVFQRWILATRATLSAPNNGDSVASKGGSGSWRRFGRMAAAATTGLALAGCSLGLIYPRLDTLVGWQLDRYLRLETGQERWLDERLEERLAWHQREQLPRWREALIALRTDIAEGTLDAERHRQISEATRELIRASMTGLINDTVQLAAGLTDKQVSHLLKHFDEETEELQEELAERAAEPEETDRERLDNLEEDVEQWLGSISKEQESFLKQWSNDAIRWGDYALESRQRWRDFIVQTLAQRSDTAATQAAVEQMFLRPEDLRTEAYQAAVLRNTEHRRALHLYLLQTMNEKQRTHLLGEIDDFLEDIDDVLAE